MRREGGVCEDYNGQCSVVLCPDFIAQGGTQQKLERVRR